MEPSVSPYLLGPGEGEARWGVDGALTAVKATGPQTVGRLAVIEDLARQGGGTPVHRHREDEESFYVLEGEMTFWLGDDAPMHAVPGTFVHIPGGVAHAFRVDSETARYLIVTTPRHGAFYHAISSPAQERLLPPPSAMDMDRVEAACATYGVEILGPPPDGEV